MPMNPLYQLAETNIRPAPRIHTVGLILVMDIGHGLIKSWINFRTLRSKLINDMIRVNKLIKYCAEDLPKITLSFVVQPLVMNAIS